MTWPWQKSIVIERQRALTESELNAALAVSHDEPLWRAIHQLIDVGETNAHENAAANVHDHGECAGYVGGGAHLRMLRDELFNRRSIGIEQLGQRMVKEAMQK